ncbi:MAG: FAD:protein FMN transferase [Solirubrobacteraceae bacterium]
MTAATRGGAAGFVTETWEALSTTVVVLLHDADRAAAAAARRAVDRQLDAMDRAASRFRPDAELAEVNRCTGSWVQISPLLWDAISLGLRAARVSDGAVDPTLGRELIEAGYDRDWHSLPSVPLDARVGVGERSGSFRPREPWRAIKLRKHPPAVCLPAGVAIDLGATAKALAADRAAQAVREIHPAGVLVSVGGDIATAGRAPAGGWRVHVTDDPRGGLDAPGQTVSIRSGGLATSSTCVRRWLHDGQSMHHILDPRDGHPVRSRWRTASVTASTCAEANIASTAAIVLSDAAPAWLTEHGLPARLIAANGCVHVQGGWPR